MKKKKLDIEAAFMSFIMLEKEPIKLEWYLPLQYFCLGESDNSLFFGGHVLLISKYTNSRFLKVFKIFGVCG